MQYSSAAETERRLQPPLETVDRVPLDVIRIHDVMKPGIGRDVERALAAADAERHAPGSFHDTDEELWD